MSTNSKFKILQCKILDWTLKISLNQLYSLNLYFLVLLKDVGVKPIVTSSEIIKGRLGKRTLKSS